MKKTAFFALAFFVISFVSCSGGNGPDGKSNTAKPKEGVVNQMDDQMFKQLVWNYKESPQDWKYLGDQPAIIDFYADWCRPCKMIAPIMDDLAKEYEGKIRFYRINTDQQREIAGIFRISSIPAIMLIPKNGKPQMTVGAQTKENYIQAINEIILAK